MMSIANILPDGAKISVLDIGASFLGCQSVGADSEFDYKPLIEAGKASLIGFEPDPAECQKLRDHYGPRHQFFELFVGDGSKATFHETNWALTGSLFEPNKSMLEFFDSLHECTTLMNCHQVQTTRLDDIHQIDDVDFIKIDVQGSELPILKNGINILSKTVLIQIEVAFVEAYKGQPMFSDVDAFLRGQQFQFHTFLGYQGRSFKPFRNPEHALGAFNQWLWGEACYVKNWMNLAALPEIKLIKLAILLHDLIKSYDLAHLVMSELDRRTGSNCAPDYAKWLIE